MTHLLRRLVPVLHFFLPGMLLGCILISCRSKTPLFERVPPGKSGIEFNNEITENDSINVLDYEYVYNGGGIGVGDFNNDGLQDLYFTGNMKGNKLYLNEGNMRFKDVTSESHTGGEGKWCSGVSVVDINNDGRPDIYVCVTRSGNAALRKNILYVNQGPDKRGIPVFKDAAAEYGLDDSTYSTQAAFFDYDNDGDLDMYLVVNKPQGDRFPSTYRKKLMDGSSPTTDRLYRNDRDSLLQHPVFRDVSKQAGIQAEGYGLGVNITDINRDGWKDVLVTNDFLSNDLLWINNRNGTFSDRSDRYFKHTSYSAMGNEVEDINNDGLVDVVALDMMPRDNLRKKMMTNPNNYITYINNELFGYDFEYARNTLQLNRGAVPHESDSADVPVFSDIGFLAGIAETDWSWTPLVADFDNDGYRDIIITNGFPRDVTDHDFIAYRSRTSNIAPKSITLSAIPAVKIDNYAFRNDGDLTFTDVTREWGLKKPSFSNGAVWADLDNDGDLDIVVNNIDDKAFLYRNTLNDEKNNKTNHWIRVIFKGGAGNQQGQGAWTDIYYDGGKHQTYENTVYRGYLSSVENMAHFGLDSISVVDSVIVTWPDGRRQLWQKVKADQVITADISRAKLPGIRREQPFENPAYKRNQPVFADVTRESGVHYIKQERDYIDFNIQSLLPHKLSQYGPALSAGDINGDGTDDLFIGGSYNHKGKFLLQGKDGKFSLKDLLPGKDSTAKEQEDEGTLLFDADNDGDLDLYVVSGSVENAPGSKNYQDRLFINDGKGRFRLDTAALPPFYVSGSCVKAADFDKDGDLDLFVGGRVEPGRYPSPVPSLILRNDSKDGRVRFTDITAQAAPYLKTAGLVTDALWTDFNNDGWTDLLICGEWMPLTFLQNDHGRSFTDITRQTGTASQTGWWNSLAAGDFDNDGDMDYVAGNLGLNSLYRATPKEPVGIYAKDFDGNGSYDAIPTIFFPDSSGVKHEYPAQTRDDLIKQMIFIRREYATYHAFATATIHDILTPEQLKDALVLKADNLQSCYFENEGSGKFTCHSLPVEAQFAPLYGMIADDFNGDGNLDILCTGNDFGTEVNVGRYDALNGLLMEGNGEGHFTPVSLGESGVFIPGDGKALVKLQGPDKRYLVAASQNQGPLKIFSDRTPERIIRLEPYDAYALIHYRNGKQRKEEACYGSSFLSQSARFIKLTGSIQYIEIVDFKGRRRRVTP